MIPKLRIGKNLRADSMELGEPWEFVVPVDNLSKLALTSLDRTHRRLRLLDKKTDWQVYSCFEAHAPNLRIENDNPAKRMLGLALDYDRAYTMEAALAAVGEYSNSLKQPGKKRPIPMPNFIEGSLGGNKRLLYVFERPVNLPSPAFVTAFTELMLERLQADQILMGFDPASSKPSMLWTNGADWANYEDTPVSWEWLLGLMMEISKRAAFQGKQEIPLEIIAKEFEARWPGKWKGQFKLDETGLRAWDENADNPSGCQIKLDGMLCFTGPYPFRKWADIFGAEWVKAHTQLNHGRMIEPFRYNVIDSNFYQLVDGLWMSKTKDDVQRSLRTMGVSSKIPKGETASEIDFIVEMVQNTNKISGVGPIVSKPPGLILFKGLPFINTANITVPRSVKGPTQTEKDFPFLWRVFQGMKVGKGYALETFLLWSRRAYISQRDYRRDMGQALFMCGPRNTGKTLIATHFITAFLGGEAANPFAYFTGQTEFNAELFSKPCLMVNDEESPSSDSEKRKLHAKIKSSVVNPTQSCHAKFRTPTVVDWTGRIVWTLNDDAGDTYQLPEIVPSTEDKMMFFRVIDTGIDWPDRKVVEDTIAAELPYCLWWLEHVWQPPKEILEPGRMGVKSYFDPTLRKYSMQNTDAYAVWELLEQWIKVDEYWLNNNGNPTENEAWVGSAAELLTKLHSHDQLKALLQGVTARSLPRSLTTLSKQRYSGVALDPDARRHFVIHRGLSEE